MGLSMRGRKSLRARPGIDDPLSQKEQVPNERFEVNDRIKVYIMDVKKSTKGPQIFLSRSHPGLVKRLFELEVPEIEDGIVEIKSIAREADPERKLPSGPKMKMLIRLAHALVHEVPESKMWWMPFPTKKLISSTGATILLR